MTTPDIFLSYNREDQAVAARFAEAFAAEGLNVWWDTALRSGEAYDEVTEAALRGAKAVVVLWSPRSVVSRWVRAEATIADRCKTLVPVMIEPCERPIMFELTQTAELSHWTGDVSDKSWLIFLGDVRRYVQREVAPVSATAAPPATRPDQRGAAPSVAVMPFANRSGLAEDESFAFGMSEDVIDALSQGVNLRVVASSATAQFRSAPVPDLKAMGRHLGVRYVLEGNLRRAGALLRVTAQLVEAATGEIVWTRKFERPLAELAELQEELVVEVAGCLDASVYRIEMERALRKPADLTAWECLARSMAANRQITADNMVLALSEASRAVEIAPDYGLAHAVLALTDGGLYFLGLPDNAEHVARIQGHIDRAHELDPENPAVLGNISAASSYIARPKRGLAFGEKAIRLRPGYGFAYYGAGISCVLLDRNAEAIAHHAEYLRLEPESHLQFVNLGWKGIAHARNGDFEAARTVLEHSLVLAPRYVAGKMFLAGVLCELGRREEAAALYAALREYNANFSFEQRLQEIERIFSNNPLRERMLAHMVDHRSLMV